MNIRDIYLAVALSVWVSQAHSSTKCDDLRAYVTQRINAPDQTSYERMIFSDPNFPITFPTDKSECELVLRLVQKYRQAVEVTWKQIKKPPLPPMKTDIEYGSDGNLTWRSVNLFVNKFIKDLWDIELTNNDKNDIEDAISDWAFRWEHNESIKDEETYLNYFKRTYGGTAIPHIVKLAFSVWVNIRNNTDPTKETTLN